MQPIPVFGQPSIFGQGSEGSEAINYILRAFFNTDDAAPVASTIEGWTIRDTDQVWSVSGGALTPSKTNVTNSEPNIYLAAGITRQAGVFIKARVSSEVYGASAAKEVSPQIGFTNVFFASSASMYSANSRVSALIFGTPSFRMVSQYGTIVPFTQLACAAATYYKVVVVCRPTGMFYIVDDKLAGVDPIGAEATLYPSVYATSTDRYQPKVDYLAAGRLPGVWQNEASWADYYGSGSAAEGLTFTHSADHCAIFKVDALPTGATFINYEFRKQDPTNFWVVAIDNVGTATLHEVVGGAYNPRGTVTVAVNDTLEIIARGNNYSLTRWRNVAHVNATYNSTGNFATQTSGGVQWLGTGGAISDLRIWPCTLPSSAKAWVDAA